MLADEHTVFDLIETINDHRRFLDAAALGDRDATHRAWCRRQSRLEATAVAKVRRGLARRGEGRASSAELRRYVDSLIDAYTGDSPGLDTPVDAKPRMRKRLASVQGDACAVNHRHARVAGTAAIRRRAGREANAERGRP